MHGDGDREIKCRDERAGFAVSCMGDGFGPVFGRQPRTKNLNRGRGPHYSVSYD